MLTISDTLALHGAVLSKPGPKKNALVEYLLKIFPDSVNIKTVGGQTPLLLAYQMKQPKLAKILVEHGADQTYRDSQGRNLLHALLDQVRLGDKADKYLASLHVLIGLIDRRVLTSLFTERCSNNPGSLTPLHSWLLSRPYGDERAVDVLNAYLDHSKGVELDLINGAGDTPMHSIVSEQDVPFLKAVVGRRPELLHRENATGRTPADVVFDRDNVAKIQDVQTLNHGSRHIDVVDRELSAFIPPKEGVVKKPKWKDAWKSALESNPKKRKLVSLSEANEVARRLTAREAGKRRKPDNEEMEVDGQEEEEEQEIDILAGCYGRWNSWDEV